MQKFSAYMMTSMCLALASCTTPGMVAKPSDVTLDTAIIEVADSLKHVQQQTADRKKVGLIVDEAQVQFQIAAKSTNTGSIGGSVTAVPLGVGGTAGLTVSNQVVNEGSRGNTVTVTFKNIATADYSKGGKEMVAHCSKNSNVEGCPVVVMSTPPVK